MTVNTDTNIPGTTATYTCTVDRQLKGSSVRECQNDGTWSQSEPTCESMLENILITYHE